MNFTRITAIAKKEFIQVVRDPRSLGMAIAIPMLLLVFFGKILTFDVNDVPLVVWDQDNTQISRDYILNYRNSSYFKIVGYFDKYKDLDGYIDKSKAVMALVIPEEFTKTISSGGAARVQAIVDGSDSNTAGLALGYANAITFRYNEKHISGAIEKIGGKIIIPVRFVPRVWFNPDLKSKNFIIPGLIAVIMMIVGALLTSLAVAREWDRGTMEQLISTPVRKNELIFGKLIPYFMITLLDVFIAVVAGEFIFHVPFRGSLMFLSIVSCVFLLGALCQGILISIATKNQFLASQLAFITTFLPAFLLSGFAFPIYNMPPLIQIFTRIIPTSYFITILRGIYLKGVGLKVLAAHVLFLFAFAVLMVFEANKKFIKKVG